MLCFLPCAKFFKWFQSRHDDELSTMLDPVQSSLTVADVEFMCSGCTLDSAPEATDSSNYHLKQTEIILL